MATQGGRGMVWYWLRSDQGLERNRRDTGDGDVVDAEQPMKLEWRYLEGEAQRYRRGIGLGDGLDAYTANPE
ncbi:hypothetical protein R3P38DRAFT_3189130 [Favolaschia claudopus]|uniref:MHC class I antigen n=1 Tax=Favolaschia claudopus TaxID=2862362 RepID=A0AAW0BVB2_9AGAR